MSTHFISLNICAFDLLAYVVLGLEFGLALMNVGGKSAILTALCVAFGCRAKGTQRASTLKDFIKTGCRFASSLILNIYL